MSEIESLGEPIPLPGFRVRIRLHQDVNIKSAKSWTTVTVDGEQVEISGPDRTQPMDTGDMRLNVRGLASEVQAQAWAKRLRRGLIVKSAVRRTGLDIGEDRATSVMFSPMKEQVKKEHGITIRDDVHGVDVFHDDGSVRHFQFSARASVCTSPETFFPAIDQSLGWVELVPDTLLEACGILNTADRAAPPIVRLALSLAALETLAPILPWSPQTEILLNQVLADIEQSPLLDPEERTHLAQVIKPVRDFGRSSSRRVKVLLERCGLGNLAPDHAKANGVRSKLLHGRHVPASVQQEAAERARQIAKAVLEVELTNCGVSVPALLGAN